MGISRKIPKRLLLILLGLAFAFLIDALLIEPNWIVVTHHRVKAHVALNLKIAHLTDLHTSGFHYREKRLLALLSRENPDIIVITGDTLADGGSYGMEAALLSRLYAPLGVWLVRGNWENWHPNTAETEFYRANEVSLLLNESAQIQPGVWLVGLDDPWTGKPDLQKAAVGIPEAAFRIALFHSPRFFEQSSGRYQIALAGHSHRGQIRLPFLKPLWLPGGVGAFFEGWFERDGSRMYVSRGIGTTILPIRFNCRPELAIITLEHNAS